MARVVIVWGLWGPYHAPRFNALKRLAQPLGHRVLGLSLFSASSVNGWGLREVPRGVLRIQLGTDEARFPFRRAGLLFKIVRRLRPDVILLPSYWHWSLLLNLASRCTRARVVMMNESHAGTARATGLGSFCKRLIASSFHAALVGGQPQKRYFSDLGLCPSAIFTGYDAIDNDYFAKRCRQIRNQRSEISLRYSLPPRYFLSLGRFVAKKNLATLIRAYHRYLQASAIRRTHLVMVGSGEEEPKLRALCDELALPICDHSKHGQRGNYSRASSSPQVHFYGFRQIDENPLFYALADAFILPSLQEEWGLVVNEAMASGLPVVVSETAGCVEDLLPREWPTYVQSSERDAVENLGLAHLIRQNGFVFPPNSSETLSRVLLVLEELDILRASMGADSRRIIANYSCENFASNALRAVETAMAR